MSVEDTSVIDFVSFDKQGKVFLTISDHLNWESEGSHILLLKEKIETYCRFLESGEILVKYPESKGNYPVISIVGFHDPSATALKFFGAVKAAMKSEGYGFEFKKYSG